MLHDLYKSGDEDAPDNIKDRNGEVVLALCRRCGKGEADLDKMPCVPPPAVPAPTMSRDDIARLIGEGVHHGLRSVTDSPAAPPRVRSGY